MKQNNQLQQIHQIVSEHHNLLPDTHSFIHSLINSEVCL